MKGSRLDLRNLGYEQLVSRFGHHRISLLSQNRSQPEPRRSQSGHKAWHWSSADLRPARLEAELPGALVELVETAAAPAQDG